MNVFPKIQNFCSDSIIQDYLSSCNIIDIKHFLHPNKKMFEDPSLYDNINEGCYLLQESILQKKDIYIIHDSDQDGDYSSALIYNFLKQINVDSKVLFQTGKQHGLQYDMLKSISDNSLIIIPDASCSDEKTIQAINKKQCYVIETDHHCTSHYNDMIVTINNQRSSKIKNKFLSGTGVTDKFVKQYCKLFDITPPNYDDLVAMSLVSDVCDLSNIENRTYIYYGLNNITNPFLLYLFEKCCKNQGKTPTAIGWNIAPLGNALARSNEQESKSLFFDGLIGKIEPQEALKQMRRIKRTQDEEVKSVVEEIEPNLDFSTKVIIGFTSPEKANFTGLIANKFTGKYNKPTILLRDTGTGAWSGSLRSPVPLATKINESGIASAQGHEEACGILVKKNKLTKFAEWLETLDLSANPDIEVVAIVDPKDITIDLCQMVTNYNQLWGHGLEQPTFYIKTRITQDNVFVFEKSMKTLKLDLGGLNCLKFFASDNDVARFRKYKEFEVELVVGDLSVNEYEGVKTPQCIIKKYEVHEINEYWNDCF